MLRRRLRTWGTRMRLARSSRTCWLVTSRRLTCVPSFLFTLHAAHVPRKNRSSRRRAPTLPRVPAAAPLTRLSSRVPSTSCSSYILRVSSPHSLQHDVLCPPRGFGCLLRVALLLERLDIGCVYSSLPPYIFRRNTFCRSCVAVIPLRIFFCSHHLRGVTLNP